jgi:hypothetical protein
MFYDLSLYLLNLSCKSKLFVSAKSDQDSDPYGSTLTGSLIPDPVFYASSRFFL